jgi:hypothetical protein
MQKTKPIAKKPKKKKGKSLGKLKRELWDLVSLYVRRSAADHRGMAVCYTSGAEMRWQDLQAGHAIPGRHNAVLYDLDIIKPQSMRDNIFLRGQHHVFATKLIEEHGMDWWQAKLEGSKKIVKYSRQDILEMTEQFKQRLEALQ